MSAKKILIIGYSGHALVALDCMLSNDLIVGGYFEREEKASNPFKLEYLGSEKTIEAIDLLKGNACFIGIGDNKVREKVYTFLSEKGITNFSNAIHKSAVISKLANIGQATMIAANTTINAMAKIGNGVICNSGCIIEHECRIGDFAHIAPGATLAGNVIVGKGSFIGANAVIKQGVTIGEQAVIGAGTVVIRDVADNTTIVGNPARILN